MAVEPIADEPAAVATVGDQRILIVADYHAGLEADLRREGVELATNDEERRERLLGLLAETDPDRLVILGDLGTSIGEPQREERAEIETLLDALEVPVTVVKGNHDGDIESVLEDRPSVAVTDGSGTRLGSVGFVHGHTWPSTEVLTAETICVGHEHPIVRLEDEVGGTRTERVWLRGRVVPAPFREYHGDDKLEIDADFVVFPAFNERTGGTWINVADRDFLAPFLPAGIDDGEAYLLNGTRLGNYSEI